jgi:acyl-coenzyme A thioesterase PaaI-like protein
VAVSLTIDPRFNGPPRSAHGGYTCGLLGAQFEIPVAVSLRVPPPLDEEMGLHLEAARARLMRDAAEPHELVAEARPAQVEVDPPPMPEPAPPAPDDPVYGELHEHPFPTCFACGPDRAPGDGLRIFAARVPGGDGLVAAGWTPDPGLAHRRGRRAGEVFPVFVWAALDCPTGHACAVETPAVLARLAVRRLAPVRAGEPHVVAAWTTERDGRKHHAEGCLYDATGTPLAVAQALWIELRDPDALDARR